MTPIDPSDAPEQKKAPLKHGLGRVALIVVLVFVGVAVAGIISRASEEQELKKHTLSDALQNVSTMVVQKGAPTQEIVLPGTVQAWHEATVYARTSGYLKSWATDIGARVKEGDILAEIDAPDLDAQYRQTQANLNTSIANNTIAQLTAKRYAALRKTDSISQQDYDTAQATANADEAAVKAAQANLDYLQNLEDFKKVVAPFDGTITDRLTDVGALISGASAASATAAASSTTTQQALFHIADLSKLRVYVEVPENYAGFIEPDLKAELYFPEHPDLVAEATLDHTADALDPTTRTLQTEFEVDNSEGKYLSGGFAEAHLKLPAPQETVIIPVNTLLFRTKMQAGVVGADNHVTLKNVTIGRDYGKTVEIVSGLSPGDIIIVNPPDSLQDGQEVKPIPLDQSKTK